jgi:Lipase maturation factor
VAEEAAPEQPVQPPPGPWARIWQDPGKNGHWLTRFLVLRLLGLIYLMAFLTWVNQGPALVGRDGLTPATHYLGRWAQELGSRGAGFLQAPSIFWIADSDRVLFGAGWLGIVLSLLVLGGYANALVLLALWALHLSVCNVGQIFYGFGWEMQLLETGFLCVFLVPLLDGRPFPRRAPPLIVIWLLRWLILRIMLGAGLIKLRGDPCWRDLTCLDYHFETQPIPSPLTPWFHALPHGAHKAGVAFNHFVELVVPFFVFGPRRVRLVAGGFLLALQVVLILSGNLAYLNWLTIVPILACFDDGLWRRLLPRALRERAERAAAAAAPSTWQRRAVAALGVVVVLLSVEPVFNLLSSEQAMNTSFNRLQLVNTYGAFGSVGRERDEIVFEGTLDETIGPQTRWVAYEWKCKPGDPARRPCWMSPYHRRLDWLIWFAAMGPPQQSPWAVHLVWKLLQADRGALGLLAGDPFGGRKPRFVRATLYRYHLNPPRAKLWWDRSVLRPWLPPLSADDPDLRAFIEARGWVDER